MKIRAHLVFSQLFSWCCALSLTLAVTGTGCKREEAQQARKTMARPAVPIKTTHVQRIALQRQVDLAGTLVSPDQAKVSSEVAGVVRQVLVEIGHDVQPGQILVKLDPRELELALQGTESLLRQAEAQLGIDGVRTNEPLPDEQISAVRTAIANRDDARAQLGRAKRLMSQRLLPQADLETAETRVRVTEAAYQAAVENVQSLKASLHGLRAAYNLAQKKLADAVIKSPVAGQVSERLVHPGEFILQNAPVVTIVQMNPLKLRTAVQERYASMIQPNLPVKFSVESYPGETFEGRVANVSPAVDQNTRTFVVEVLVENHSRKLKPGFFTKGVILVRRDENLMAVPDEAVSTLAGVSNVYVVNNNKVRQQIVTLGAKEGRLFEVVSGLKGDELLATTNLSQLANGVPVQTGPAADADPPGERPAKEAAARGDKGVRP
ncbi:MAG TPA: efflux RND transporter periplasmic adaptor subunit [Acidobacteriota bacterium]|nr:efflux RND transporter periplasmic adaptor subunit [Acidobacteriota bacterium]